MSLIIGTPYRRMWRGYGYPEGWYTRAAWPAVEASREAWTPRFEYSNRDKEVVFRVRLEDVKPEDIDVAVEGGVITFKGTKVQNRRVKREGYEWSEETRTSFSRSIALPRSVDAGEAEASFSDGVLEVTIPRTEPARPRRIEVHKVDVKARPVEVGDGSGGTDSTEAA